MVKLKWSTSVGVILTIAVIPACDSGLLDNLELIFSMLNVASPPYHPSYIKKHPDSLTPVRSPGYGEKLERNKESSDEFGMNSKSSKENQTNSFGEEIKKYVKYFTILLTGAKNKMRSNTEDASSKKAYFFAARRKGQTGRDRTALIILVPKDRKQSKPKKLFFGHTQFKPSQDIPRYSDSYPLDLLSDDTLKNRKIKAKDYINLLQRRSLMRPGEVILGVPTRPEHLPRGLPIHPGHTLLRPARGMLKSAVKYPLRDFGGSAVYGNLDNLGITLGKSRSRIRYSDFRKANDILLNKIQSAIQSSENGKGKTYPMIVMEIDPSEVEAIKRGNELPMQDANANEVYDDVDTLLVKDNSDPMDLRRKSKIKKSQDKGKYYKRSKSSRESVSDSSTSSDESPEKNDGNPYTIFKNKYKQNWLWNHKFDGVHMNINPYAPQFNQLGPTGAELFYGRKWWYFNQDDFKPIGRKR